MINDLISTDLVWRLGWTLLHSVWQILVIGLLVALGLLLARKSTTVRYWISCCGLVLMYVPMVVTFAFISPPVSQESDVVLAAKQISFDQPWQFVSERNPQSILGTSSFVEFSDVSNKLDGSDLENESQVTVQAFNVSTIVSWLSWLVASWCMGVAILAIWNGGGWIVVHKLRSHGTAPVDESLRLRMERLSRRLRVSRPVTLIESMLVEVPMVIGWLRPMILMPASLLVTLSPDQLDAILAHELAHIRRHDYLMNLFQLLTESLLFYHPVTWILSRQIRIEREFCCDDVAIAACSDKSVFVQALAKVESSRPIPVHALSLFGRGTSMTLQRARRIMGRSRSVPHTGIVGICALLLAVIVGFGVADSMRQAAATDNTGHAQAKIQRQASMPNQQVEQNPAPPAGKTGKFNPVEAGIDVKRFRIDIAYEGPSDKPFYQFTLSTYPFSRERSPMWQTYEVDRSDHAKLGQIVTWLNNSGFFLHAKQSLLPQAPGAQRYVLRVTSGDEIWAVNLGWDLGMLLRLDSLRKVLAEGDAQAKTPLDPLLNRLSGFRRQWTEGRVVNDIKTQLSASKKAFQEGKPIKVKLKVENTGDQTRKVSTILGDQGEVKSAVKQIEFKVFDRYGHRVPFLAGTSQFLEFRKSLEPGQAEIFEFDLAKAHYLRRPGLYTAVYESWNQLDSNSFEFEVTTTSLNKEDLVGRLLPLLHDEWYMIANPNFKGKIRPGINFEEVDGFPIRFQNIPKHGNIGDISMVWLWFTKDKASPRAEVTESRYPPSSEYLGKTGRWYFYAFADERSLKRWPTVLEDVKKKFIKPQGHTGSFDDSKKPAKQVKQIRVNTGKKSVRADALDGKWWLLSTQLDDEAESFDQGEMNALFQKQIFYASSKSDSSRSAKRRFKLLPDQCIDFFDERDGKQVRTLGRYQLAGDRLWIAVNDDIEELNPNVPLEAVNLAPAKGVRYMVLQRRQPKAGRVRDDGDSKDGDAEREVDVMLKPPQGLTPRETVNGFLDRLLEGKKTIKGISGSWEHAWAYTTRENGWSLEMQRIAGRPAFRAVAHLGSENRAMVLTPTERVNVSSVQPRVGVFDLVRRDGRWLIQNMELYKPDNAWLVVEGFARNEDVRWSILRSDLIGAFHSGFSLMEYQFNSDGSYNEQARGKPTVSGTWRLEGNRLIRTVDGKKRSNRIVRLFSKGFVLDYGKGNRAGYYRIENDDSNGHPKVTN